MRARMPALPVYVLLLGEQQGQTKSNLTAEKDAPLPLAQTQRGWLIHNLVRWDSAVVKARSLNTGVSRFY